MTNDTTTLHGVIAQLNALSSRYAPMISEQFDPDEYLLQVLEQYSSD